MGNRGSKTNVDPEFIWMRWEAKGALGEPAIVIVEEKVVNNHSSNSEIKAGLKITRTETRELKLTFCASLKAAATQQGKAGLPLLVEGQISFNQELGISMTNENKWTSELSIAVDYETTVPPGTKTTITAYYEEHEINDLYATYFVPAADKEDLDDLQKRIKACIQDDGNQAQYEHRGGTLIADRGRIMTIPFIGLQVVFRRRDPPKVTKGIVVKLPAKIQGKVLSHKTFVKVEANGAAVFMKAKKPQKSPTDEILERLLGSVQALGAKVGVRV